jgi:steroid delta-isomerase-like uncharacterized protein
MSQSIEQNKAIVREFFARFNSNDTEQLGHLLAPDYVGRFGEQELERDRYFEFMHRFRDGLPDLWNTIEELIAEDDRVAVRTTWSGTHLGEFLGVAATGRRVSFISFSISRLADRLIAEQRFLGDMLGVLQQLDAVPVQGR